jgi:hypothetical protein
LIGGRVAADAGDANCDGRVNADDLAAVTAAIFDSDAWSCPSADVNRDARFGSADLTALGNLLAVPAAPGPEVAFIGLAGSDGTPLGSLGRIDGVPVYFRTAGFGFKIVIEGRPGFSGLTPGVTTFNSSPSDSRRRPDLQIESSRPLGDGSTTVCEGGVPALDPPDFGPGQEIANVLNDLACSFAAVTSPDFACTVNFFGANVFLGEGTGVQFCLQVPRTLELPNGETTLSVRLRDTGGNLGPLQQLRVRIGPGPAPPTFTFSPTPTPPRPTPTRTSTVTRTATRTRTRTATATRTSTATISPSPTATRTATPPSPSVTPTRTPTPRPGTPTRSPTSSPTPTPTPTRTRTRTRSPTPTSTPTVSRGPIITFFGLTRSDDSLQPPAAMTSDGAPIFVSSTGFGFSLVVEGKAGPSGSLVGLSAYAPVVCSDTEPGAAPVAGAAAQGPEPVLPDLQVQVTRPLGNGSTAVCDASGSNPGGVPAIDPPSFLETPETIGALNDLGCRFVNGDGLPCSRPARYGCVLFTTGELGYARSDSTAQFCGFMNTTLQFPPGDTLVTARLRDRAGNVGAPARLVVRVGSVFDTPTLTPSETPATPSPTSSRTPTSTRTRTPTRTPTQNTLTPSVVGSPTRTPTRTLTGTRTPTRTATRTRTRTPTARPTATGAIGPVITFLGLVRSDDILIPPTGMTPEQIPFFQRLTGSAFSIVVEGRPGPSGAPVGTSAYDATRQSLPDLQVVVSRPLGNGSTAVCDNAGATAGGVPAVDPPSFDPIQSTIDAVNDLTCRFVDGIGNPGPRGRPEDSCVTFGTGESAFVSDETTLQFCGFVTHAMEFPPGDTRVTVRLRDRNGNLGETAALVVRVGS